MEKTPVRWGRVFILAGAFCSFWIGSGFATGQEVLQYAATHGLYGGLAVAALYAVLLGFLVWILYGRGQKEQFKNPYDIFEYYCGKVLGNIFVWFSVVLTYGIYVTMMAGAGAAINQYYGLDARIGTWIVAILALGTALLGVEKLIDIIGVIGPIKIVFLSIFGVVAFALLFKQPDLLATNSLLIQDAGFQQVTGSWVWSAVLWWLLGLMFGITFFVMNSQTAQSQREARLGGVFGVAGAILVVVLLVIAEVVYLDVIAGQQVPTLAIARAAVPWLAVIFAPILILCIYAAVSSLLLVTTRKFAKDKTKKFNLIAIGLSLFGMFFGTLLPFDQLVNILYPISGYAAIPLMGLILYKEFINKNAFPFRRNEAEGSPVEEGVAP